MEEIEATLYFIYLFEDPKYHCISFFLMCHLHFSYKACDKLQISVAELPVDDVFKAMKEEMKDFRSS